MKCIKKLVALTLAAVLALAMLTACGGTPSVQDTTEATKQVVDNINAVRTENGLSALEVNTDATDVASKIVALQEKKTLKLVSDEDYATEMKTLTSLQVGGKSRVGYFTMISTSSGEKTLTKEYWQELYDSDKMNSICRIVTYADAAYVGAVMKQVSNGTFITVIVTY